MIVPFSYTIIIIQVSLLIVKFLLSEQSLYIPASRSRLGQQCAGGSDLWSLYTFITAEMSQQARHSWQQEHWSGPKYLGGLQLESHPKLQLESHPKP